MLKDLALSICLIKTKHISNKNQDLQSCAKILLLLFINHGVSFTLTRLSENWMNQEMSTM